MMSPANRDRRVLAGQQPHATLLPCVVRVDGPSTPTVAMVGDTWLPTSFNVTIKYWVGKFKIGRTFYEDRKLDNLNCTARAMN